MPPNQPHGAANLTVEYVVIGVYLLFLVFAATLFRGLNRNAGDYFKSGSKGSWWLIGMSLFVSSISAHTFTGNAGAIYEAGWSPIAFYLGNTVAFLINAAGGAALFRQTRATTYAEVVEQRFGPATQQVYAYAGVLFAIMVGATWLYGLSIFSSTVFGLPLNVTIVVLAVVAVGCSTLGGSWAVMSTDFVQGLILISITLLISFLCIHRLGGPGAFFHAIAQPPLGRQFRLWKGPAEYPGGTYSIRWFFAVLLVQVGTQVSLAAAPRFFAAKDGREANRSALLAAAVMAVMSLAWFIPPMAGRLLFPGEISGIQGLAKPAEGVFAVVSVHLLPEGLSGLMVVAMCAATISSMDTALNRNAAMLVRDILPPIRRRMGAGPADESLELRISRWATLLLGLVVTLTCIRFATLRDSGGVFALALKFSAVFGLPLTIPLLFGMFVRRVPWWAGLVSLGFAALPGIAKEFAPADIAMLSGLTHLTWTRQVFWEFGLGAASFLACVPFHRFSRRDYLERSERFFERMRRPVDFRSEVGSANDALQLRRLGLGASILSLCMVPLLYFTGNDVRRWGLVAVIAGNLAIAAAMLAAGRRAARDSSPRCDST